MRSEFLKRSAERGAWGIFCAVALAACGSMAADKTVTSKKLGFEITFPETWENEMKHPNGTAKGRRVDGAKDYANIEVVVEDISADATLKSFVEDQLKPFKNVARFKIVEQIELKLGETNAFKVTFTKSSSAAQYTYYFLVSSKRGYIITTYVLKEDYDKYAKDIDAIVQSFKLLKE
jgi:hypothetical protein